MTSRERVAAVMSGGEPDRVPYQDSYWATTVERWQREGLPADVSPAEHFGCEIVRLGGDYTLQLPVRTIEESSRYRIYVDSDGATRKVINTGDDWTPYWLDFTIKTRHDWERLKPRAAFNPSRLSHSLEAYAAARKRDRFVTFSAHACFHPTWHKIGMENFLVWLLEDPEWMTDMFEAHTQLILDLYEGMREQGMEFDAAWLSDDLGYRTAPLISPRMYRELVMPHHQRLCDRFAADGLRTILHSDGDVRPLIPDFLEAGFAALHPLEAKAGLDVRELREEYGDRLILFGNIDVRKLAGTREEVEEEVRSKVTAGREGGGYIFHSDHSVPKDVPLANYQLALETLAQCGGG